MELKITGREIALFIDPGACRSIQPPTTSKHASQSLNLAMYDECSYTLMLNELYDIEAWVDNHWVRVELGDIYAENK